MLDRQILMNERRRQTYHAARLANSISRRRAVFATIEGETIPLQSIVYDKVIVLNDRVLAIAGGVADNDQPQLEAQIATIKDIQKSID